MKVVQAAYLAKHCQGIDSYTLTLGLDGAFTITGQASERVIPLDAFLRMKEDDFLLILEECATQSLRGPV